MQLKSIFISDCFLDNYWASPILGANLEWDLCEPLTQIQQDSTKKIICANLWLKKHQFNPLKPNLHLFKNIKIGVNGFQIGLNRCLFQHLPYPAAAFR